MRMASVSGLATELTKMADRVRDADRALGDGAASAKWNGKAAEQFREHAQSRSKDFRNCVDLLDDAVKAVRALAARVG